jgi:hypothetical protein
MMTGTITTNTMVDEEGAMSGTRLILSIPIALLLTGFTAPLAWAGDKAPVEAIQAQNEIPEENLLDVGIQVFDPGLPEDDEALDELEEKGVFADVRKSEARYIPIQLAHTLQTTGYWGAVRVVPAANAVDVMVSGTILSSNGKKLELEVRVHDARGKRWLKERYKQDADTSAYKKKNIAGQRDPYQSLYNRIANDILKKRNKLDDEEIQQLRTLSRLKFAADLAPTAFADYLKVDEKKGRYSIEKLPAKDDPMMERVALIRERDYMFIDTLNEFYANFYSKMDEPYDNWRAFSYEEQVAIDKLKKEAWIKTLAGIGAIVGGAMTKNREAARAGAIGGMILIPDGLSKFEETKMYREALKELAASLDSDVAPLLIDVEGEITRLTGSVETQYATWRALLRQIFASQTGLPIDPNDETVLPSQGPSPN